MRRLTTLIVAALAASALRAEAAPLRVVTTTEDLASIVREVGGGEVEAESLAKGYQDPHFVDAKPSFLLKLRKADLFVQIGLELEVAWAPGLLANARNPAILPGAPGFLEASEGCEVLQVPTEKIDRSKGDVHPFGNPHHWTDPENGRLMARNVERKLSAIRPEKAGEFAARREAFEKRLDEGLARWKAALAPYRGAKIVTYHNSWPNFAKRFGLHIADFVEPRPGVPPSPRHVQSLVERIRAEEIPVILMEPYFDARLAEKIARDSGARLVLFPPTAGGAPGMSGYLDVFELNVAKLAEALAAGRKN